jgi:hypothetical protein
MEFIYPKEQALKIAQGGTASVLAYDSDEIDDDPARMRDQKVGRVDSSGRMVQLDAETAETAAPASAADTTTTDVAGNAAAVDPAQAPQRTTEAAQPAQESQANRTPPPAPSAAAARAETPGRSEPTPVGTSGQDPPAGTAATADDPAAAQRELPRTASSTSTFQLLAGLSLLGAVAARQVRRRYAATRAR